MTSPSAYDKKPWHQPSGLSEGLPFTAVNATWAQEQALAMWALLDGLRDRVWSHYGWASQNPMREQYMTNESPDDYDQDLPF